MKAMIDGFEVSMKELIDAVGYPRCVNYIHFFDDDLWFEWLVEMLLQAADGDKKMVDIVLSLRKPSLMTLHERWKLSWSAHKIARCAKINSDDGRYQRAKIIANGCWSSALTAIIEDEALFYTHFNN